MSKNNGGPAYPVPNLQDDEDFNGMSLRDALAIGALSAAMTTPWRDIGYTPEGRLTDIQNHARLAYQMADAMLVERAK